MAHNQPASLIEKKNKKKSVGKKGEKGKKEREKKNGKQQDSPCSSSHEM